MSCPHSTQFRASPASCSRCILGDGTVPCAPCQTKPEPEYRRTREEALEALADEKRKLARARRRLTAAEIKCRRDADRDADVDTERALAGLEPLPLPSRHDDDKQTWRARGIAAPPVKPAPPPPPKPAPPPPPKPAPPPDAPDGLVSIAALARHVGRSPQCIYVAIRAGRLTTTKHNGLLHVTQAEADRYVAAVELSRATPYRHSAETKARLSAKLRAMYEARRRERQAAWQQEAA